jgi:hypothetical protein
MGGTEGYFLGNETFRKCFRALVSYMGYFGSRYVGNDIQLLCGNIFDHPVVKTFTLFCIMFQATNSFDLGLTMTVVFLILQYVMSISPMCNKYIDKTSSGRRIDIHATAWPHDRNLTALNLEKQKAAAKRRHD